jgi:hypothetical protein
MGNLVPLNRSMLRLDRENGFYTTTVRLEAGDSLVERLAHVDAWDFETAGRFKVARGNCRHGSGDLTVWIADEEWAVWWLLRWTGSLPK